ncbi:hypothetical protein GCM10009582_11020 [Arthrobacter flavus]
MGEDAHSDAAAEVVSRLVEAAEGDTAWDRQARTVTPAPPIRPSHKLKQP